MTFRRTTHLTMAILLLVMQVLWVPQLRAMPCGSGAGVQACCCAVPAQAEGPARRGCCGNETPGAPTDPVPCGCKHRPAPVPPQVPPPLPPVENEPADMPAPAPRLETLTSATTAFRRAPEPRSRTGPPLHLRFCVFLH